MQGGLISLRRDPSPPPSAWDRIQLQTFPAGRVRLYTASLAGLAETS